MQTNEEIEALFARTQRGPFRGEDISAEFGDQSEIPNEYGGVAQDLAFPMSSWSAATTGLYNGDLLEGPPDGDESILDDIENKLPGWSAVPHANITIKYDTTTPPSLKFTSNGSALIGDEAYVEQIVPIGNAFDLKMAVLDGTPSGTNVKHKVAFAFLNASGAVIGTDQSDTEDTVDFLQVARMPTSPLTTHYARVRFGVEFTDAADSGAEVTNIGSFRLIPPMHSLVAVFFAEESANLAIDTAQVLYQPPFGGAVGSYIAPTYGFVMGVSGRHNGTITGGEGEFGVNIASGTSFSFGAQVIDSGNNKAQQWRLIDPSVSGNAGFDFAPGDSIRGLFTTDSSWNDGVGGDISEVVHLMLVIPTIDGYTTAG